MRRSPKSRSARSLLVAATSRSPPGSSCAGVKRLGTALVDGQGELFTAYRYHAILTDSPLPMLEAEADHRRHAVIEHVIADLKAGALAHLPSGKFAANSAWLALAAIAYNVTRAAGTLAGGAHAGPGPRPSVPA